MHDAALDARGGARAVPLDLDEQGFEAAKGRGALPEGEDALGEFRAQFGDFGVDVEEIGHGEPPLSR